MNDDQEESDDPGLHRPAWIKLTSKTYCACVHVVAPPTVMLSVSTQQRTEKLNNFRKKKKKSIHLTLQECKILHGRASKTSADQQTLSKKKGWIIILKYMDILQLLLNFICRNICLCFNSCGAAFSSPNYTSRTLRNSFSSLTMAEQNLKRQHWSTEDLFWQISFCSWFNH